MVLPTVGSTSILLSWIVSPVAVSEVINAEVVNDPPTLRSSSTCKVPADVDDFFMVTPALKLSVCSCAA